MTDSRGIPREWRKRRRLRLAQTMGEAQAGALEALRSLDGIEAAKPAADATVSVCYDLRLIDHRQIEQALAGQGIALDSGLPARIRRALVHHMEEVQREAAAAEGWDARVQRIYLARYRSHRHGRRDDRPQQWRKYLRR